MVRLISNSAAWLALAVSLSFAGCAHGFSGGASAFALMGLRKGGVGAASSAETLSNVVAARSLLQGSAGARGKRHSALGGASSLRAEALSGAGLIFGPRGEEEGEFFDRCVELPRTSVTHSAQTLVVPPPPPLWKKGGHAGKMVRRSGK
jgi:hypothetical protein